MRDWTNYAAATENPGATRPCSSANIIAALIGSSNTTEMADSTEGDTDVQYLGLLAPALIGLIAGLVIHSFIIGVNVTDWWKGRSVTPVDHIVTSLAISRMCAQCAVTLYVIVYALFLSSLDLNIHLAILGTIYIIFSYASIWLTSLLSIVHCLKISNFHSRLFMYLRGMIVPRTVYFIGASILFSILKCLVDVFTHITEKNKILLFTSLYQHIRKMKMSRNLSINLETYYSVIKLVSVTFIYSTIYFIGYLICQLYYYFYCVDLLWLHVVSEFPPVLHSSYLIYRTPKLRSQMSKVLQNVRYFCFQRKATKDESIEVVAL
ncbi:taste receptor type 2 member 104-like [Eleutherodactylus coqui]|uniref:taste receptor type 2 member 104-like n=1 Tax=Eleutherodactylus coqui TaxID=57060 RepID=UPI00346258B4